MRSKIHPGAALSETLPALLTTTFALAARNLLDQAADPQTRWQCLRPILPELARLRQCDQHSQRLELDRRRSDRLEAEARDRRRLRSPPPHRRAGARSRRMRVLRHRLGRRLPRGR